MPISIKPVSTSDDAIAKPSRYIGIDTETALSSESCAAPSLACLTIYGPGWSDGEDALIYDRRDAPAVFADLLRYCLVERVTIVANHLPYDISILLNEEPDLTPLVFEMLDRGLFECTLLCEKLDDIARGQYDNKGKCRWHDLGDGRKPFTYALDASMRLRCGVSLDKSEGTYRTRFGELIGMPLAAWPAEALRYAKDDARAHWFLREAQENAERASPAGPSYVYADAPAQTRAGVALALMRIKGIRTDPVHTKRLIATLQARVLLVVDDLISIGFLRPGRVRPRAGDWVPPSRDTKKIKERIVTVANAIGVTYKRTDGGDVSMDGEALEMIDDPHLNRLREYVATEKLISYTKILSSGFDHAIHSEPNTLVANGRISWGSDAPDGASEARTVNLTNLPTEPGIRECYVPRQGNVIYAVDYAMLELCVVAQCCVWMFGSSALGRMINEGVDLHSYLGALLLSIPYEDFLARRAAGEALIEYVRDLAKRANFGLWGGMGIDRFMSTCSDLTTKLREVGIVLSRDFIVFLKKTWQTMNPETHDYFKDADSVAQGSGQIVQFISKRVRGGLQYTDTANTRFSGLAADGAKEAMYKIQRASFAEPDSPLFGSHMLMFVHDEFDGEGPEARGHEIVTEVARIARETMQEKIPDVKIACSMALMRRLRKGAKEYRVNGRIVPHEESPKFQAALARGEVFA